MKNKVLTLIICFIISITAFEQEKLNDINWFNEKGGNGHNPGHSNGNGHKPGHSNGNGHNHAPIGTGATLLIILTTGGVIYKLSKNKKRHN